MKNDRDFLFRNLIDYAQVPFNIFDCNEWGIKYLKRKSW
jgi:hypothetical protein